MVPENTILEVKQKLAKLHARGMHNSSLYFNGTALNDSATIRSLLLSNAAKKLAYTLVEYSVVRVTDQYGKNHSL